MFTKTLQPVYIYKILLYTSATNIPKAVTSVTKLKYKIEIPYLLNDTESYISSDIKNDLYLV